MGKARMKKIGIKCKKCGDEIYSEYRHAFVWCNCHAVAVDGGNDYLKITGNEKDYETIEKEIPDVKETK